MYIQYHLVIFMAIALVHGEDKSADKKDSEKLHGDDFMRRFMDKLNDEEWHIAHLKPVDFQSVRRSGCKEDSVTEKIKKYRKSLKEDAGRLEYVSADPLPVSDNDIKEYECKPEDDLDRNKDKNTDWRIKDKHGKKRKVKEVNTANTTTSKAQTEKENKSLTDTRSKTSNKTVTRIEDSTTTAKDDEEATVTTEDTVEQLTEAPDGKKKAVTQEIKEGKDTVRRSDYIFSSAEDETDVAEFSGAECPDVVEIIMLEQDIIRSYDVECELSIVWSSLE